MRTSIRVSLIVTFCVLIGVAAVAASSVTYPDGSSSQAINLGNGQNAFVFFDNFGDGDIFVHPVDFFGDLLSVNLNGLNGFAFWLDFEGLNQGFMQFGVYACSTSNNRVSCSVSGTRRGTLFL